MPLAVKAGDCFGDLQVTEVLPDHINPKGKRYQRVHVKCACGHSYAVNAINLLRGTKQCRHCTHAKHVQYHVGNTYGHLTIIGFFYDATKRRMAVCRCSCGQETTIFTGLFKRITTPSCGCKPIGNYQGCESLSGAFYSRMREGAKRRELAFDVTKEELWHLYEKQQGKCALTGAPVHLDPHVLKNCTASVDRIDSKKGYTPENVQWVHKDINRMKQTFSQERFLHLCRRVCQPSDEPLDSNRTPHRRSKPGKKPKETSFM